MHGRYIYTEIPADISDLDESERQRHLQRAEEALVAFDHLGYLLQSGHVDPEQVMENLWAAVWRCWRKSVQLIMWSRERRLDPTFLRRFEYLFSASEDYRLRNNMSEPGIY